MKYAMENAAKTNPQLRELSVYVAQDCTVYKEDVLQLCLKSSGCEASERKWNGVIIFVPVRLGGESFNPAYSHCIQQFLADSKCIGIIGGRPKHSLHFIGWQDDKLIHLDPHYCQEVVDVSKSDFPLQSFHCLSPRKMSLSRMDPSCTIGFYCRSEEDFNAFAKLAKQVVSKQCDSAAYPIFIVADGKSSDGNLDHHFREDLFSCQDYRLDSDLNSDIDSEDEFVLVD